MASDAQTPQSPTWPLFPPEVDVPEENPFAHDRLSRKVEAENLTVLLDHSPSPLVLGLDAAWGTGKTTFVKMWRRHLENEGYKAKLQHLRETSYTREDQWDRVLKALELGGQFQVQ